MLEFGSEQLCLACSRVSSPTSLKFALLKGQGGKAVNIVFREVLLHHSYLCDSTILKVGLHKFSIEYFNECKFVGSDSDSWRNLGLSETDDTSTLLS